MKIARGHFELWNRGYIMELDNVVMEIAKFGRIRPKVLKGV